MAETNLTALLKNNINSQRKEYESLKDKYNRLMSLISTLVQNLKLLKDDQAHKISEIPFLSEFSEENINIPFLSSLVLPSAVSNTVEQPSGTSAPAPKPAPSINIEEKFFEEKLTGFRNCMLNLLQKIKSLVETTPQLPEELAYLENICKRLKRENCSIKEQLAFLEGNNLSLKKSINSRGNFFELLNSARDHSPIRTSQKRFRPDEDPGLIEELKSYEERLNKEKEKAGFLANRVETLEKENEDLLRNNKEKNKQEVNNSNNGGKLILRNFGPWLDDLLEILKKNIQMFEIDLFASKENKKENIQDLEEELSLYKKSLRCYVCNENKKDCVISKCGHTFCERCLESNLKVRNRKCPTCNVLYDKNDIIKIFI